MSNGGGGGFRFTDASREGRELAHKLLALTRDYEDIVLPYGTGVAGVAVVGLVARSRHLLKVALREADVGDDVASAIMLRALAETLFTIAWLDIDLELGHHVWMLDEIRSRLSQHEDERRAERNRRRRARRRGEKVDPVPSGETLGLLSLSSLARLRSDQKIVLARAKALPDLTRRKRRLEITKLNRMPTFQRRALAAGLIGMYSISYRFDSNSAAHPNAFAIEQFLEEVPEGILVRSSPKGPRPDPYVVGTALLLYVLDYSGKYVDQSGMEAELKKLRVAVEGLPRP